MAGMSDTAKQRLKELAALKKGRDTLMGLDHTTGMVAFDSVQDRDGELPDVRVTRDGFVVVNYGEAGNIVAEDRTGSVTINYNLTYSERNAFLKIPWVRLKRCPTWIEDEFAKRWGARKVATQVYAGPSVGSRWETVTVVPIVQAIAWFRFLWPQPYEWGKRVRKYFVGYTEDWVQKHPGVGARVLVMKYYSYESLEGETAVVRSVNEHGRASIEIVDIGVDMVLDINRDEWKVVG